MSTIGQYSVVSIRERRLTDLLLASQAHFLSLSLPRNIHGNA